MSKAIRMNANIFVVILGISLVLLFLLSCASRETEPKEEEGKPLQEKVLSPIPQTPQLSKNDQQKLMEMAHKTLEASFTQKKVEIPEGNEENPLQKYGVFVTLKKEGELRGCIGHITPQGDLFQEVTDCTLLAAFHDNRFPPVEKSEVADISMEISLLSPMEELYSLDDMELGVDGILVVRGNNRGILLPQVALEESMSKEEFVSIASMKAGLGLNGWRAPGTNLYRFRVLIISDS